MGYESNVDFETRYEGGQHAKIVITAIMDLPPNNFISRQISAAKGWRSRRSSV
jgi:hypothetical protein